MSLNERASTATSAAPDTRTGRSSLVTAICSTAPDSCRTGRRLERATAVPAAAAIAMPSRPITPTTSRSEVSTASVPASGRPTTRATPGRSAIGIVTMR